MTFPTVRSARPSFPPPVPTAPLPDPGGRSPSEAAYRTQASVVNAYHAWRAAHSPNIDPDVLKGNAGAFSTSGPAQQLSPALAPMEQAVDDANHKVTDLIKAQTVAPEDVPAANWYWQSAVRNFDATNGPAQIASAAQALIANADAAQQRALADQLPSYLASRNVPTGWLPGALAAGVDGLSDAVADAKVATKQLGVLRQNYSQITAAMAKDLAVQGIMDPASVTADDYQNPANL
jgi:hypothetical protein